VSSDNHYHRVVGEQQAAIAAAAASTHARRESVLPFPVVGIGASAGGVQALQEFFGAVQTDSGMAYVVVQHLSPDHTSRLQSILSRTALIPVTEVAGGEVVEPDRVYVIAPGCTLTMSQGRLALGESIERHGRGRPIDDFFRSLAEEQREKSIAVVLSGTGTNGTAGCQAIKAAGGICVAQDPDTAAFPGMPQSLIHAGYADQVLEPALIPALLSRYVQHSYLDGAVDASRPGAADGIDGPLPDEQDMQMREGAHVREILAILRTRTRHDFTGYRKPTLMRRILRRLSLSGCDSLAEYGAFLRENPQEVTALANDLMINVTGFFRDPEAWEALRTSVIAPLVSSRAVDQPIRAWVTACASGEEAYTLAMILSEEMRRRERIDVKIFATDTADRSLALARAGVYPAGIEADLSAERLERFFDKDEHTYRVKKEIRDMVVFAPQDVLRDPPFSRVDLCTCRNLLIYLEPETQRRVLALLHFALRDGGYLFLGNTETYSGSEHLFEVVSKRWRIYRRMGAGQQRFADVPSFAVRAHEDPARLLELPSMQAQRPSAAMVLQRALLERYAPPTVVVDRQDQVLYFHGATERFLGHPAGEPTRDLMQLVRPPLRLAVRTALRTAMRENRSANSQSTTPGSADAPVVEITAAPVIEGKSPEYFLVSFRAFDNATSDGREADPPQILRDPASMDEVRMLRLELQNTTEAFEATNEELKAANEEATSMNEELQSTNEELETSKEELQSVNEELTTVNNQLQTKITQLEATTNDLANLLGSTDIAVVFLDAEFRVRRFTAAVNDLLELRETDIGRPVTDLAQKFTDDRMLSDARSVLQKLVPLDREIQSHSGRWYLRRTLPYRTAENHIEGVVITFVDIGFRKRAEEQAVANHHRLQAVIEQLPAAVVIAQAPNGRLLLANQKAVTLFKQSDSTPVPEDPVVPPYLSIRGTGADGRSYGPEDWPLSRTLSKGETVNDEEVTIDPGTGEMRIFSVNSAPVRGSDGQIVAAVGTFVDVTPRKGAERKLSQVEQRFRQLLESARDLAIFSLDSRGVVQTWNSGAERMLGWSEREIVGQSTALLFTPEDRAGLEDELRIATEAGRASRERWYVRKDGARFWASGTLSRVENADGDADGFVKVMRDETDRKLAEERLRAAGAETHKAQTASHAKDDFISIVSHELRTPLNTIRLWVRMLRNENLSPHDREEGIGMIERAVVAQQQVIDDLFDVSRIDSGKLRLSLRETRLADAIRSAVEAVEPVAAMRGLRLTSDINPDIGVVRADPGRIQQVVWNLLSNAVKFTPSGGRVDVQAGRFERGVRIEVKDTGIGIRREFLERVFDRFKQAEVGSTRKHNGLGLGLSIARQLVELHGGTISVSSEGEGKGSTFIVELPLMAQDAAGAATAPATPATVDLGGIDVLVVEDEETTRVTMKRLLERCNAKVRVVDSVSAARDEIATRAPRVVLSDIGLPGEDGYALIRHLRGQQGAERIPAIAVTAFTRPEDRQQVLDAGFDEHLAKPLDVDQMVSLIARMANR
jgi:two-component system, chemotaxis family, CheB/CheR fusion protein